MVRRRRIFEKRVQLMLFLTLRIFDAGSVLDSHLFIVISYTFFKSLLLMGTHVLTKKSAFAGPVLKLLSYVS